MTSVSLTAELRQELKLTPQLLQSMEVLQMNSQDLTEYLNRAAEENPLLDLQNNDSFHATFKELQTKASWLDAGSLGATFSHGESAFPERGALDQETESLTAFLNDQLDRKHLSKPLLALSKYIANLVDEDGYLAQEDLEGLTNLQIPESLIDQALSLIHSLEPAGVGARNLSECLLLQLARQNNIPTFVADIVSAFLPDLGKKHYSPITKALGITIDEILAAEKIIAALEPYPGRAYRLEDDAVTYVRPDIFIVEVNGEWKVILNEYYLPRVSINSYYEKLLKETGEQKTKDYLHQKMQQVKWLLNNLERRGSTLRLCAEEILKIQISFFSGESTELQPMSISSMATALNMHSSTISRAVRDKYLQCKQGCYPLRYFFSLAVNENGLSSQAVKQKILKLIKEENPSHPLSDQKLCQLLSTEGVEVSRRVIAKYRLQLGIGSSTIRKRHEN